MSLNYTILAQTAEEFASFERSPLRHLWHSVHSSLAPTLLNHVSIYAAQSKGTDQAQLLYLNLVALGLWTAMSKAGTMAGQVHLPPQTAKLVLGMPFRRRSWSSLRWAAQRPLIPMNATGE